MVCVLPLSFSMRRLNEIGADQRHRRFDAGRRRRLDGHGRGNRSQLVRVLPVVVEPPLPPHAPCAFSCDLQQESVPSLPIEARAGADSFAVSVLTNFAWACSFNAILIPIAAGAFYDLGKTRLPPVSRSLFACRARTKLTSDRSNRCGQLLPWLSRVSRSS